MQHCRRHPGTGVVSFKGCMPLAPMLPLLLCMLLALVDARNYHAPGSRFGVVGYLCKWLGRKDKIPSCFGDSIIAWKEPGVVCFTFWVSPVQFKSYAIKSCDWRKMDNLPLEEACSWLSRKENFGLRGRSWPNPGNLLTDV